MQSTAVNMRLGSRTGDLRAARPGAAFTRQMSLAPVRQIRTAVVASKQQQRKHMQAASLLVPGDQKEYTV